MTVCRKRLLSVGHVCIAMQAAQVRKDSYVPEPGHVYDPEACHACTIYAGTMVQQVSSITQNPLKKCYGAHLHQPIISQHILIWPLPNVLFAIQIADWQMNASCLPHLANALAVDARVDACMSLPNQI